MQSLKMNLKQRILPPSLNNSRLPTSTPALKMSIMCLLRRKEKHHVSAAFWLSSFPSLTSIWVAWGPHWSQCEPESCRVWPQVGTQTRQRRHVGLLRCPDVIGWQKSHWHDRCGRHTILQILPGPANLWNYGSSFGLTLKIYLHTATVL